MLTGSIFYQWSLLGLLSYFSQDILTQYEKATNVGACWFFYTWESDGSWENEKLVICFHLKFLFVHDLYFLRLLKYIWGVVPGGGRVSKYRVIRYNEFTCVVAILIPALVHE